MNKQHPEKDIAPLLWGQMINEYALNQVQVAQLERYLDLLIEWNQKFNLTAITDPSLIVQHHFQDSLALSHFIDFSKIRTVADIGTGAGFPGLPLKILFPHLVMILIEVNSKKRSFLEHVVNVLRLTNVIIYPYDWRTFLRMTDYKIDYFFARASLQPEELIRIFKPASPYRDAIMIYWASQQWVPQKNETSFIEKKESYSIGSVPRKYIFFRQGSIDKSMKTIR